MFGHVAERSMAFGLYHLRCGVLLGLAICAGCVYLGWRGHAKFVEHTRTAEAKELGEQERARLIEQQQAFRSMMDYSTDIAYGLESVTPAEDEE